MTDWTTCRMTPEMLAELRWLLDANEVPWSAHRPSPNYARYEIRDDRGYDLAYTVEDALGGNAEIIVAAVNALPALLDAAAERDALAAKVERVRELHKSSGDAETQGYTGREYGYISPYCMGEVASDEYGVPWPCETIRAIDGAES